MDHLEAIGKDGPCDLPPPGVRMEHVTKLHLQGAGGVFVSHG